MNQIGLISDVHASLQPLEQALTIFTSHCHTIHPF